MQFGTPCLHPASIYLHPALSIAGAAIRVIGSDQSCCKCNCLWLLLLFSIASCRHTRTSFPS